MPSKKKPDVDLNDIESVKRHLAALETAKAAKAAEAAARKPRRLRVKGDVTVERGDFVAGDLVQIIHRHTHAGEDKRESVRIIGHYVTALAAELSGLRLNEIAPTDATRQRALRLPEVYVPLNTQTWVPKRRVWARWMLEERQRDAEAMARERETRPVPVLEALAAHRVLTLLGPAGSGKSSFGAAALLALAEAWGGRRDALADLGKHWRLGPLLPVRVVLRRFAETLSPGGDPACAGDLWRHVGETLQRSGSGLSPRALEFVQRIAIEHGALIVLDGLDECGGAAQRARVRAAVEALIASAPERCRFVVTARPYAWAGGADPAQGVHELAPLDDAQVEAFITRWYEAVVRNRWRTEDEAAPKRAELLRAWRRADLEPLARNPLLLTRMAALHDQYRLPDDRADLYDKSVELLLQVWTQRSGSEKDLFDELGDQRPRMSDIRRVLAQLAFEVHRDAAGGQRKADIEEWRLLKAFEPLLGSLDKARRVVQFIESRAGLLVSQGAPDGSDDRRFEFPHRSFQEYLAATHLAARKDFESECRRLARAAPGHWDLVLPLAARVAGPDRGLGAAAALVGNVDVARHAGRPDAADWACATLAGLQLLELGADTQTLEHGRATVDRVRGWLVEALPVHPMNGGLPAHGRARAGDVLAALGDPRFDPARWHLPRDENLGFVCVQGDPDFSIGTRSWLAGAIASRIHDDIPVREINDLQTPSPPFYIARFPVTVAQFAAFVETSGMKLAVSEALRDPPTRPVRWVSWYEATAYARWLGERLATLEDHPLARLVRDQGWYSSLPTELEWEKAARGDSVDWIFPWGDEPDRERANIMATGLFTTSAVGCFEQNDYGLSDMVGNVWESTCSFWANNCSRVNDAIPETDLESYRVVRGGSWGHSHVSARCASRSLSHPYERSLVLGFRVVLRSSSSSSS